jgi:uroporphyrin-III C-methyltransferase
VALVGAGPGDPDLLTRRAATLLGAADVVLHDWLAGRAILGLARPDATLIDVGKGKGCGAGQRYIERLIVAHHGSGGRVVRLKGGDPFLFGRGMEEVSAGRAAGFDVEVVPGISSALAAPALAGVSVTERHVSAQVTIVSGHRVEGDNDWPALARGGGTLLVMMAATTGPSIAQALLDGGLDAATPVAVVVDASGAGQTTLAMDLAALACRRQPLPGPCVLVIGAVAARAQVTVSTAPPGDPSNDRGGSHDHPEVRTGRAPCGPAPLVQDQRR